MISTPGFSVAGGISGILVAIFAAALFLAAFALVLVVRRYRRAWEAERDRSAILEGELAQRNAILDTAEGHFRWSLDDSAEFASPRLFELLGLDIHDDARFDDVLAALADTDARALKEKVESFRETGVGFTGICTTADGKSKLAVTAQRVQDGIGWLLADILWFSDDTESAAVIDRLRGEAESRKVENDRLRNLFNALPIPAWWRNTDFNIVDCNSAYADAVEAGAEVVIAESRELAPSAGKGGRDLAIRALASGEAETDERYVVVGGTRRRLAITEQILKGTGDMAGFALDLTEVEEARTELKRHLAAHADLLENLGTAIAIFGADKRLKFFNAAYAKLWQLEEGWLAAEPTLNEILEVQRAQRRLPEYADFPGFKK